MSRSTTKRLSLLIAVCATVAAIGSAVALAGGKPASAYDPMSHSGVSSSTIHLYSFRSVTAATSLTFATSPISVTVAGTLFDRDTNTFQCHMLHRCTTDVQIKLAGSASCSNVFGKTYSRLYVRPIGSMQWRELQHYHDVVTADCS